MNGILSLPLDEKVSLVDIDRALKSMRVTVSWDLLPDLKNPPEGDIFAFLLDKNNKSPLNEDFIFFNQPDGVENAAHLSPSEDGTDARTGGVQSVIFELDKIRYEIIAAVVGFNLYRAGERDQNFRFLESLTLTIHDETGKTLASHMIDPQQHKDTICTCLLMLEREGTNWHLTATNKSYPAFEAVAREHGIVVAG